MEQSSPNCTLGPGIDGPGLHLEVEPDDVTHDGTSLAGSGAGSGPGGRYREISGKPEGKKRGRCLWGIDYEQRLFDARLEGVLPAWGDEDKPCTYIYVLKFETNLTCLCVNYSHFL